MSQPEIGSVFGDRALFQLAEGRHVNGACGMIGSLPKLKEGVNFTICGGDANLAMHKHKA